MLFTRQTVKLMCETRWIEKHTALEDFDDMYSIKCDCLDRIGTNDQQRWDSKSITDARRLVTSISGSRFIYAFQSALYCFGYTKALSVLLQGSTHDILTAYEEVSSKNKELQSIRQSVDSEFAKIFTTMAQRAGVDSDLPIPRRCSKQTLRWNIGESTPVDYWKATVFIPFLDHLICEFSHRCGVLSRSAVLGMKLLPPNLPVTPNVQFAIYQTYLNDLPSPKSFQPETKFEFGQDI